MAKGVVKQSENNINYTTYYPENITPDTPIIVYTNGGGGNDPGEITKAIAQLQAQNSNCIVVFPQSSNRTSQEYASNVIDFIENIQAENGIRGTNVDFAGFSSGNTGMHNLNMEYITRHPEVANSNPPRIMYMVDTYPQNSPEVVHQNNMYENGGYDKLKESGTIIFNIHPRFANTGDDFDSWMLGSKSGEIQRFVEHGIPVLNVYPVRAKYPDVSCGHIGCEDAFWQSLMVDFSTGKVNLPAEADGWKFRYKYFDQEAGMQVEVDPSQISNMDQLCALLGVSYTGFSTAFVKNATIGKYNDDVFKTKVDFAVLYNEIEKVFDLAQSTKSIQNEITGGSCESTTKVPSEICAMMDKYFANNTKGIAKIISRMQEFERIGVTYYEVDKYLAGKLDESGM